MVDANRNSQAAKPNFLIVGAAKCGTTSLASILGQHPDCCMSRPKEVCFFQDTMDFKINLNYSKGWDWYQQAFAHYKNERMVGEATPSYSDRGRSPTTAKRIFEFNPEMKIIYMVRDPLDCQVSSWKMQYAEGTAGVWEDRRESTWALEGFNSWMTKQKEVGQWDICRYSWQLDAYREFFPTSQILVSILEKWKTSKEEELARIMKFLDLDPSLNNPEVEADANAAADRRIERQWLKPVRNSALWRLMMNLIPEQFKANYRQRWTRMRLSIAAPELDAVVKSEFIEYVRDDCVRLLTAVHQPWDIWPSMRHSSSVSGVRPV